MGERKVKVTQSDSLGPHGLYSPWTFPGQNTGGIEPRSPTLQVDSLSSEPPGKLWEVGGGKHKGYIRVLGGREEEKVWRKNRERLVCRNIKIGCVQTQISKNGP